MPRICRWAASTRMARSWETSGSRSPCCLSCRMARALPMPSRSRSRWPGLKSEMRSSMPPTPVRAANSGAYCAWTSRRIWAFWLLRAIHSRLEAAARRGAGAACEQAKRRAATATRRWGRMWPRSLAATVPEANDVRAAPGASREPARRCGSGLLLLRLLRGGLLRGGFGFVLLAHEDDDVGGVLAEVGRDAHRGADTHQLRVPDHAGLLREFHRVGFDSTDLVHLGEPLVERRLDLADLRARHLAFVLGHLGRVLLRNLLELRVLRHRRGARIRAALLDALVQLRLDRLGVRRRQLLHEQLGHDDRLLVVDRRARRDADAHLRDVGVHGVGAILRIVGHELVCLLRA